MEITKLSEVYTPSKDHLVVEMFSPKKSKGGVILPDSERDRLQDKMFAWKVLATGEDVKEFKVDDYVIIDFQRAQPTRVPLIYKADDETQHIQVREFEIMGKVDKDYVIARTKSELEPVIN